MSTLAAQTLLSIASEYYQWRNEQYAVLSSSMGLHTWDDRLTDYSPETLKKRRQYLERALNRVLEMKADLREKEEQIDWMLLRSQLESAYYLDDLLDFLAVNPQVYVRECSNGIFSLLKKEYAPGVNRAQAAIARFTSVPLLLEQARENLSRPVSLYTRLAITSIKSIVPLFTDGISILTRDLSGEALKKLQSARDKALEALFEFGSWLEGNLPRMSSFHPLGRESYDFILSHILLLPFTMEEISSIGRAELARFRTMEAWLDNPDMANPDPLRSSHIPSGQEEFLRIYESRQDEILRHLKEKNLVTIPEDIGHFMIRELPAAFKPTSPGGFMNPPGLYDADPGGFYFIPTYSPDSPNFYIRAAIEEPRPILAHEGIPGHFLQISRAHKLGNEIRRQHHDGVFVEGWALYTEEMLLRTGLYEKNSAGEGQVLRLGRYRSARIEADLNIHTGVWSFEDAIRYFLEEGGLDGEAAEGEASGAASMPTQKISYTLGKWQIMRLLGRYRDIKGKSFKIGEFHDMLLSFGSLPLSIIEWLLLDDRELIERVYGLQ